MIRANLRLTDYDATGRPGADDLDRHTTTLSSVLTKELEGAATATGLTSEEILLAAFGRAIQRTIGAGFISVDIARHETASYPMALACVGPDRLSATDMLGSVHHAMAALSAQRFVAAPSQAWSAPRSPAVIVAHGFH